MKRLHIPVFVNDPSQSIRFYSTLFGAEPSRVEVDRCCDAGCCS